jgi:hypothetical protein
LIGVVCSMYQTIGCFGGLRESDGSAFSMFQRLMKRCGFSSNLPGVVSTYQS